MDQETDQIYFEDTDTEDNYEKVEALDDKSLIFEELITKFEKKDIHIVGQLMIMIMF